MLLNLQHLLNPSRRLPNHQPLGQDEVLLNSNQRLDHLGHLNSQLLRQLALRTLGKKNEALLDFLIDQALKVLEHSNPPQVQASFPRRYVYQCGSGSLPTRRRERGEPPTPARTLIQRLAAGRPPVASPGIHYA
ncbi:hypothetical protein R3P38DRAFT_3242382 [Favolaschia claudopus]|uniref:Uncharacterized protein n=1 Tax=Favolaschia claudopus TaxID=2862362 RepID=A0AAV9Z4L4_9AGAR